MVDKQYPAPELVEEKDRSYKAGFQAGEDHSNPSRDTINFMRETGNKINKLSNDITEIKTSLKPISDFVKTAKNEFARKEIEQDVKDVSKELVSLKVNQAKLIAKSGFVFAIIMIILEIALNKLF